MFAVATDHDSREAAATSMHSPLLASSSSGCSSADTAKDQKGMLSNPCSSFIHNGGCAVVEREPWAAIKHTPLYPTLLSSANQCWSCDLQLHRGPTSQCLQFYGGSTCIVQLCLSQEKGGLYYNNCQIGTWDSSPSDSGQGHLWNALISMKKSAV